MIKTTVRQVEDVSFHFMNSHKVTPLHFISFSQIKLPQNEPSHLVHGLRTVFQGKNKVRNIVIIFICSPLTVIAHPALPIHIYEKGRENRCLPLREGLSLLQPSKPRDPIGQSNPQDSVYEPICLKSAPSVHQQGDSRAKAGSERVQRP